MRARGEDAAPGSAEPVEPADVEAQRRRIEEQAQAVRKVRAPRPKLSITQLLDSEHGMKRVLASFPDLKLKGKGHESRDIRVLMNAYREWAFFLFPNAPWPKMVELLEKLGSSRQMHQELERLRQQMLEQRFGAADSSSRPEAERVHVQDDVMLPEEMHAQRERAEVDANAAAAQRGREQAGGDADEEELAWERLREVEQL
jgi:hypothetical protein